MRRSSFGLGHESSQGHTLALEHKSARQHFEQALCTPPVFQPHEVTVISTFLSDDSTNEVIPNDLNHESWFSRHLRVGGPLLPGMPLENVCTVALIEAHRATTLP